LQALPDEERCILGLVNTAINYAKEDQIDLIQCCIPEWHSYAKILSELGFISLNWIPKRVEQLYNCAIFYMYGLENLYQAKHKWFYTFADTDYA